MAISDSFNGGVFVDATVAIVEDHSLVRGALESVIAQRPGLELCWSGDSLQALLDTGVTPAVTLLDLDLHGKPPSVELVAELIDRGSAVLVVSALADPSVIRTMLGVGVAGFVAKQDSASDLTEAIDEVVSGGQWTTPELAGAMADDENSSGVDLSDQERRVLVMYASGMKIATVAHRLEISPHTVKEYLKRIRAKFADAGRSAITQTDLHREARRDGLLGL
ncbi:MAG: response regulator transcription factor [Actinomycetes bacterium]